jgi:hypothetical protein
MFYHLGKLIFLLIFLYNKVLIINLLKILMRELNVKIFLLTKIKNLPICSFCSHAWTHD